VLRSAVDKAESNQAGAVAVDEDDDYSQRSIRTDTGGGSTSPGATAGDDFLRGLFERGDE